MEMKHMELNTDGMTCAEVDSLIQKLRAVRTRKQELHNRISNMQAMVSNMKEAQMAWVNRYTGEVFDPEDWALYDETTRSFYDEVEMEMKK